MAEEGKDKDALSSYHPFQCPWGPLPKLPTVKTSLPSTHLACRPTTECPARLCNTSVPCSDTCLHEILN